MLDSLSLGSQIQIIGHTIIVCVIQLIFMDVLIQICDLINHSIANLLTMDSCQYHGDTWTSRI